MPTISNISQVQVQEALAAILEALEDTSPVLTDWKFSQNDRDLHDLLAGEIDGRAKGWVLQWKEITAFEVDGNGCTVNITNRYRLTLFYPYLNKSPGNTTSQAKFELLIDNAIDALARNRWLASLGGNAEILALASRSDFVVIDWINSTKPDSSHFAEFDIDVRTQRTY